jgi:hypothetical protein
MPPSLSHVALLVRSAKSAAAACKAMGYEVGDAQDFSTEGTREVYVGPTAGEGLLLIMEAIGPGPYRNALEKRGPGLHHIAVDVASVKEYVASLAGSGWLLHPASLGTLAQRKTVYLTRPGLRVLIEVQERDLSSTLPDAAGFISEVFVEGNPDHRRLLNALQVNGLQLADGDGAAIAIGGKRIAVAQLTRG